MDATDVRIFCEIAFGDPGYHSSTQRHVSPSEIGRKLAIDEKTVRQRIRAMERAGFIKYYQAIPSLSLFHYAWIALYRFEAMNITIKQNVLRSLQQVPNVVEATDYIGPNVSVDIAGNTPAEIKSTADHIAGRFELTQVSLGIRPIRAPNLSLDRLDWQIVQRLRYDARISAKTLARAMLITPRMAEYRIRKLLDMGALLIRAVINPQEQKGLIFYELELSVEEKARSAVVSHLREIHGEKLWSINTATPDIVLANLFAFTLREPEESALMSQQIGGVRYCHLFILKEFVEPSRSNWLDQLIEEKTVA